MLEVCKNPELVVEVTLMPIKGFSDLDAAILFSDILLMLEPMGVKVDFVKGEGPHIEKPIATESNVKKLRPLDPKKDMANVFKGIKLLRKELDVPLIGFAGAPFTVASYMIEGGPSKDYLKTKGMMHGSPKAWHMLMEKLSDEILDYLKAQITAGVQAIQLFDSWIGTLSPSDYKEYVLPYSKKIFQGLKGMAPTIHFGTGTAGLLELMAFAGGDVIGVDWRVPLDKAWERIGFNRGIQGNLDPAALLSSKQSLGKKVNEILDLAGGRPGHIFNLGHGVLPETPPENIEEVIRLVHEYEL